jgi:hypothetical protein
MDLVSPGSPADRSTRLLRWYPAAWRQRHGDEMVAFMEDSYGDGPVPTRVRLDMARGALAEHGAQMGLGGRNRSPAERLRGGAFLVLSAWGFFVVGGSVFAKATEGWKSGRSPFTHGPAAAAFTGVLAAAVAGAAVIVVAVAVVLPAFVRHLRAGGWSDLRRPILGAAAVTLVTTVVGSGVVVWAHHLTFVERNGGYWPYGTAFLLLGALFVATVAAWTVAACRTVVRLELPGPVLRTEGVLALVLTTVMAALLSGTIVWWATVAADGPRFLSGSPPGPSTSPVTPNLLIAGLCMGAGLALAVRGAGRVTGSLRTDPGH